MNAPLNPMYSVYSPTTREGARSIRHMTEDGKYVLQVAYLDGYMTMNGLPTPHADTAIFAARREMEAAQ